MHAVTIGAWYCKNRYKEDSMDIVYENETVTMTPGIFDVHEHPRVCDPLPDGKAGLEIYTEAQLRAGIVGGNLMPNEFYRTPF